MKRLPVYILLLFIFFSSGFIVYASSQQAYQDYLYQFDVYRQTYTDFQVAKNEYAKFKSLTSQSSALDKTKTMLSQRDQLLRAYLLLLNEKLNEDTGISTTTKQLYRSLITSEVTFLENHAKLVPSIGSIDDAERISEQLESHYSILQVSIRQILIGLSLGQLTILSTMYDKTLLDAQTQVQTNSSTFTPQKQETINRWLLQITNKKSLYQQKFDAISSANSLLHGNDIQNLERQYSDLTKSMNEARQYLKEGASFMTELVTALKYVD